MVSEKAAMYREKAMASAGGHPLKAAIATNGNKVEETPTGQTEVD